MGVSRDLFIAVALALSLLVGPDTAGEDKTYLLCLSGAVTEHPPGKDSVLSMRGFLPDETLQKRMAERGIVFGAERFSTQMTWDYLKQFNVIMTLDFPIIERHETIRDAIRATEKLLARFVEEGGGLLVTGVTEHGMWGLERNIEELNRFLEPYNATVLHEQVDDKNAAYALPSRGAGRMAWTGNVCKHPLTDGVRGLIYPTEFPWAYTTHPLRLGNDWQTLIKGSGTAHTYSVRLGTGDLSTKKPGSYTSEPPIVAVRQSGRGRIALWPVAPTTFFVDAYHPFWGSGLVMEGTDKDLPSDGRRLLFNLLDWLAAPTRGQFGGYAARPMEELGNEPGFQPVDWDKVQIKGKPFPNCYKGLIGMRSSLTSGQSSPREMIAAAREARYHFAAFAENLEELTAEELDNLRKLCAEESGETFQAYPGFTYHDESGNTWVTFGPQITWPKEDWWSRKRPGAIVKNNMVFRGYQFPPVIMIKAGQNPEPACFQGNFKGIALYTYENGKVVDDSSRLYLYLQANGFNLFPAVVHETRSAQEIRTAAAAPFQTYVRWHELSNVISALSGNTAMYKGNYVFHRTAFASAGPRIENFQVYNFGTADLAVPQNDRYRIHLAVSSPGGLKEVRLMDGEEMYRRFLLKGEKEWTCDVEGYQDKNRHFVAVTTDNEGGTAYSAVCGTSVQEVLLVRCTDNLNTYTSGKYTAVNFHPLRGLESYIDRQAGNFNYFPAPGIPETERLAVEQQLPLVSRFGYVRKDVVNHSYPPSASANWNLTDAPELAQPLTVIQGATTVTMFAPRADATSVYLVEGEYRVLQDHETPKSTIPVYRGQWVRDAEICYISRKDGHGFCGKLTRHKPHYFGPMDQVEYAANLAPIGGSRAIIPLAPNMAYSLMFGPEERSTMICSIDVGRPNVRKGETLRYRYLAVWSGINPPPDNGFVEEVCEKLGLRNKTAYTVAPRQGKVLDTTFALRLQAENFGFAGLITQADLPMSLPVFIEGLNPRWAAGILYRGRNALVVPVWRMSKVGNRHVERVKTPGENQLHRFAVLNGTGMLQVDTAFGDKDVYIGNLLICDQPEAFLSLDDTRPGKRIIAVNNPTDKPMKCTIRPGPGFDLLGEFEKTVTVGAGECIRFSP